MHPGAKLDVSISGGGLKITMTGHDAHLVSENSRMVIDGDAIVTDEMMYALMDAGRR